MGAQIHLMLSHLPVVGVPIGALLLAYGLYAKDSRLQKVAMTLLALLAFTILPVYFSGDAAEEVLEGLPGVSKAAIETHEEWGEVALIAVVVVGVMSALILWVFRRNDHYPTLYTLVLLLTSIIACGILAGTAHQGGYVRHPELGSPPLNAIEDDDKG